MNHSRQNLRLLLIVLLTFPVLVPLFGQYTIESVPNPKDSGTGYVSDPDDYIPAADEQRLNTLISSLEDSATAQIAVVVLESIGQENPKDFATRLFNHWGIGQADVDNGLLILSVMDQRRTEFETGYGLEGVLPDAVVYRVGMQELVPNFKDGEYGQGLIAATEAFKQRLENPEAVEEIRSRPEDSREKGNPLLVLLYIFLGVNILFAAGLTVWISRSLSSKEGLYDKYLELRKTYSWGWFAGSPLFYGLIYFFLRRKLNQLREHPRFSKRTGAPMRKLSEAEEDQYLDKGQVTEEEIGTADYDVWITEDGEDILILRYGIRQSKYEKCPECDYTALYHVRTETVKEPTDDEPGKKEKLYECKNCGYHLKKYVAIPKKGKDDSGSWGGGVAAGGASWGGGGSWGGGSSGGSSFGGGSSGGGGGGVSW